MYEYVAFNYSDFVALGFVSDDGVYTPRVRLFKNEEAISKELSKEYVSWYFSGPEWIKDIKSMKDYWIASSNNSGYGDFEVLPFISTDADSDIGELSLVVDGVITDKTVGMWQLVKKDDREVIIFDYSGKMVEYGFKNGSLYKLAI